MTASFLTRLLTSKQRLTLLLSGLLIFLAGWQTGRLMSPYYAAHPITFIEANNVSAPTVSNLIDLKNAGSNPSPSVASATSVASIPNSQGQFVGSVNSNKYHHLDCSTWKQIKPENQIWFDTQEEAEAAGYIPTSCTKEKLGIQ